MTIANNTKTTNKVASMILSAIQSTKMKKTMTITENTMIVKMQMIPTIATAAIAATAVIHQETVTQAETVVLAVLETTVTNQSIQMVTE